MECNSLKGPRIAEHDQRLYLDKIAMRFTYSIKDAVQGYHTDYALNDEGSDTSETMDLRASIENEDERPPPRYKATCQGTCSIPSLSQLEEDKKFWRQNEARKGG